MTLYGLDVEKLLSIMKKIGTSHRLKCGSRNLGLFFFPGGCLVDLVQCLSSGWLASTKRSEQVLLGIYLLP